MNRYYVETMVNLPEPSVSGKVAARVYHYIHAYSEEQVREMFKECKILEIFDHTSCDAAESELIVKSRQKYNHLIVDDDATEKYNPYSEEQNNLLANSKSRKFHRENLLND